MSDNTKQKKAIRDRQNTTGESYSTARMRVLRALPERIAATVSGFRAVVDTTIRLAEAAANADRRPISPAVPGAPSVRLFGPEQQELRDFLLALPEADLRKVEVLMYAGRSNGGIAELAASLSRDSHEITVDVVAGKTGVLAEYLCEGLRFAATEHVDIDASWVRRPTARWAKDPGSAYDLAIDGMRAWDARIPVGREAHDVEALKRAWAEREGVTPSDGHACLLCLTDGGCPNPGRTCQHLPGCDHTTLWIKASEPHIYVTQPYELSPDRLDAMFRVCRRLGLTLRVDSALAWHDAGAVLIEVFRVGDAAA